MEHVTLYRPEGSNQIYQVALRAKGEGYVVSFAYGHRGSNLTADAETPKPLPYAEAKAIYEQLVKAKMTKGYTVSETATHRERGAGRHDL